MFSWITKIFPVLFGSSDNGKGVVQEVNDVVERWIPSAASLQENSVEDIKLGDASQESARQLHYTSHESWFDILVDGLNRLPRPMFAYYAFGVLNGWIPEPEWATLDPLSQNIIWTVVGFYFGSRFIYKDIPAMWNAIRKGKA